MQLILNSKGNVNFLLHNLVSIYENKSHFYFLVQLNDIIFLFRASSVRSEMPRKYPDTISIVALHPHNL
jgi:hypothetical protein